MLSPLPPPATAPVGLLVVAVPELDRTVVRIVGEADLGTARQLHERLVASLDHGRRSVVVDAAELVFCDLSGLDALSRFVGVAERSGVTVTLQPSRQLAWLIALLRRGARSGGQADHDPSDCPLPQPRTA